MSGTRSRAGATLNKPRARPGGGADRSGTCTKGQRFPRGVEGSANLSVTTKTDKHTWTRYINQVSGKGIYVLVRQTSQTLVFTRRSLPSRSALSLTRSAVRRIHHSHARAALARSQRSRCASALSALASSRSRTALWRRCQAYHAARARFVARLRATTRAAALCRQVRIAESTARRSTRATSRSLAAVRPEIFFLRSCSRRALRQCRSAPRATRAWLNRSAGPSSALRARRARNRTCHCSRAQRRSQSRRLYSRSCSRWRIVTVRRCQCENRGSKSLRRENWIARERASGCEREEEINRDEEEEAGERGRSSCPSGGGGAGSDESRAERRGVGSGSARGTGRAGVLDTGPNDGENESGSAASAACVGGIGVGKDDRLRRFAAVRVGAGRITSPSSSVVVAKALLDALGGKTSRGSVGCLLLLVLGTPANWSSEEEEPACCFRAGMEVVAGG